MVEKVVPHAVPPGSIIRKAMNARGWRQADLAFILGIPASVVSDLVTGKRRITPPTARGLADAFGNEPEEWVKLQAIYDATKEVLKSDDLRARKSRLLHRVPVPQIINRGWLTDTNNIDTLEAQILEFYNVKSIDDIGPQSYAARKSTNGGDLTSEQLSWFIRAKNLAEYLPIKRKFNRQSFKKLLDDLELLRLEPEEARKVPKVLEQHGIRFFIIEHLRSSKIDGVCFWVGAKQDQPVIVLSMRYDRVDWFWFTLVHELAHVYHGHGKEYTLLDTSLVGKDAQPKSEKIEEERLADDFASEYLIESEELEDFIGRQHPLYSDIQIRGFADRMNVHPGIVIGRLQHLGRIPYSRGRRMLVNIRDCITNTAITDGWGHSVEV